MFPMFAVTPMGPRPNLAASHAAPNNSTPATVSHFSPGHVHRPTLSNGKIVPMNTSGPTGTTPMQVRHAYGIDNIQFAGGTIAGDGAGTTIAIVDAYDDPTIANDLHQFDLAYGLPDPPSFTKINQNGVAGSYPSADSGWAGEIALDVEWAHAVAPGAKILLVEANSASDADLYAAVDTARNYTNVVVVSMSWGGKESSSEIGDDFHFTTPSGHGGVTFLVSSGDAGAPAEYPSASPNVISVGGTTLNTDSQGNVSSETAWSGSGGGISKYEAAPSYQSGLVIHNGSSTVNANGKRATPDIAYDADPNTGFGVYDSYNNGTLTPWGQWGGTSDAAPQWAGIIAIANQGRALSSQGFLDGKADVLPNLYSHASSNLRDITSGNSTGSPYYTAYTGYDLATGLGVPKADILVGDLVGQVTQTATHYSVTTSASSTAGSSLSVTVSALDANNAPVPGYLGTVHFTSSDGQAVLPSNYTFVSSERGTHTFATPVLKTAGSQSLTATDTATGSINGNASVMVNPAAASQLAFSQQPSNVLAGSSISPAVTVRALDAYNNLATNDNSLQVSMAIGTNPGSGTLGGNNPVTVSSGAATFSSLTVNNAGTGYTLVASAGGVTSATSGTFNVTASTAVTLEGFETPQNYRLAGGFPMTASFASVAMHDGVKGLKDAPGNDWIYRTDAAAKVQQGDTLSTWVEFAGTSSVQAFFGFGSGPGGTLSLVASPGTSQLMIQDNTSWGSTVLGTPTSLSFQANHWYRLQIQWSTTGAIVGQVMDSDGATLLGSVSASNSVYTTGGFGFKATGNANTYWDTVQRTSNVNYFAVPAVLNGLA